MGPIFDVVYRPDETGRRSRLTSPAGGFDTASLDGMAPALIVTCGTDILREVGIRYAERLDQAGSLREHIDLPEVGQASTSSEPHDRRCCPSMNGSPRR